MSTAQKDSSNSSNTTVVKNQSPSPSPTPQALPKVTRPLTPVPTTDTKRPTEEQPRQTVFRWFQMNTFTPSWLPRKWYYLLLGYLVAVLLQGVAAFSTLTLTQLFPTFAFRGVLGMLVVALIALNWGVGPGGIATLVGAILLNIVALPPHFAWTLNSSQGGTEALLFLLVGMTISILASRVERMRQSTAVLVTSLAAEHGRLNAILETMPGAVSIHDAEGTIVQLNRVGQKNAGPKRGNEKLREIQSAYGVRTVTGKPLPMQDFPVARALRGEITSSMEMRYFDAQGRDRSILASAAPLRGLENAIEGVVLIMHDVTALRVSERELVIRASQLDATFRAMVDGILVYDQKGNLVQMNPTAHELFALDGEPDYLSLPLRERVAKMMIRDDQGRPLPREQWPMERVLRGEVLKDTTSIDVMIHTMDGRDVLLGVRGAPMHDEDGDLTGGVLIVHDVTEQRRLERRTNETLRALLAMAETLVNVPEGATPTGELPPQAIQKVARRLAKLTCSVLGCSRVAITAIEPETNILSPVAVYGLSANQEEQWWDEQSSPRRLDDGPYPDLVARLRANEVCIIDMSQPPYSGQPNPYGTRVILVVPMCVGGQLVGTLSLDHGNVEHEYGKEEVDLAKAVGRLAALVIERERLLRERAESRANQLALQEANRRMNEFIGMTSHELRTPLTTIKGNTQLAMRQFKSSMERFQRLFEGTERQVGHLNRLVDDLLDISRPETEKMALHLADYDLVALVRNAVEEQLPIWPTRTLTLDLPPEEQTISVYMNADRVMQVINNYLSNAFKYSPEDRPVQISVQQEEGQARLSVQDAGVGLSPAEQQAIWERFYRVHGAEVQSTAYAFDGGLGLGLHISKMIIEQHHGQVGVQSALGEGSTFWFTLPLNQPALPEPESGEQAENETAEQA